MDRRQVQDIESHRLDFRKIFCYFRKRTEGTRKELVPGREARVHGIDDDFQRSLVGLHPRGVGLPFERFADLQIHRQVLPRLLALLQVALPGEVGVGPAAHRVLVAPEALHRERRPPVVVAEEGHRDTLPIFFGMEFEKKLGQDCVVSVSEDVGLDDHALAHHPLHGVATAIDLGLDRFNDDARRRSFPRSFPIGLFIQV